MIFHPKDTEVKRGLRGPERTSITNNKVAEILEKRTTVNHNTFHITCNNTSGHTLPVGSLNVCGLKRRILYPKFIDLARNLISSVSKRQNY